MPDKPQCGGNCNQCSDCPDLRTSSLDSLHYHDHNCLHFSPDGKTVCCNREIETATDSKLYMQGFEDGKVLGYRIAHKTIEADRKALENHWRPEC